MAIEMNSVEIENLALLKFSAPPDRRKRWQARAVRAIRRAHPNNHRAMFVRHRVEVINRFEIAGNFLFRRFIDFFLLSIDDLFSPSPSF
jgi:hypothetical protein